MIEWTVATMDDGIAYRADSMRAAVAWLREHAGGPFIRRITYGAGDYRYVFGFSDESSVRSFDVTRGLLTDHFARVDTVGSSELDSQYE